MLNLSPMTTAPEYMQLRACNQPRQAEGILKRDHFIFTGLSVALSEAPLSTIVANLEEGDDTCGIIYYYFPCSDLTYVTTDKHGFMMLLKDSGREYEPQTPEMLLFQSTLKKADNVNVIYVDGSKYYGGIAMDSFYGFLRHGDGNLRDGDNLLLSMGLYYQNESVSKHAECHNPDFCVNKENTYGFGTDSSGRLLMHPTICENCDTSYMEIKGVRLDDLAGVNLQHHLKFDIESHLMAMFSKAFNSSHSNAVVVRNRFFTSPWERRTMIHNLFNRKRLSATE